MSDRVRSSDSFIPLHITPACSVVGHLAPEELTSQEVVTTKTVSCVLTYGPLK